MNTSTCTAPVHGHDHPNSPAANRCPVHRDKSVGSSPALTGPPPPQQADRESLPALPLGATADDLIGFLIENLQTDGVEVATAQDVSMAKQTIAHRRSAEFVAGYDDDTVVLEIAHQSGSVELVKGKLWAHLMVEADLRDTDPEDPGLWLHDIISADLSTSPAPADREAWIATGWEQVGDTELYDSADRAMEDVSGWRPAGSKGWLPEFLDEAPLPEDFVYGALDACNEQWCDYLKISPRNKELIEQLRGIAPEALYPGSPELRLLQALHPDPPEN